MGAVEKAQRSEKRALWMDRKLTTENGIEKKTVYICWESLIKRREEIGLDRVKDENYLHKKASQKMYHWLQRRKKLAETIEIGILSKTWSSYSQGNENLI